MLQYFHNFVAMNISYNIEISNKPNKNNNYGILLRITQNRKHRRISTGVEVPLNDFNKKAPYGKWIRRSNPKYKKLNTELENFIEKTKDVKLGIEQSNQATSLNNIITGLKTDKNYSSFIEYAEEKLNQYSSTKSYNYFKNSKSKFKHLQAFTKNKGLLFAELDVQFLNQYEAYLYSLKLSKNTIHSNLKIIRSLLYEAINEGRYTGSNPFDIKKLSETKVSKSRLSLDQIKTIQNLNLKKDTPLWHTRNYFLFSFYMAGIRVGDFIQLKWSSIEGDRLNYNMNKTSTNHSILITAKAKEILDYYSSSNHKPNDYIFPLLTNIQGSIDKRKLNNLVSSKTTTINKNLKKLAKVAEIDINLTFHLSRHSYADILRKKNVSIYDIKNLLGHSDIKITQRYLASFDQNASDNAHLDVLKEL